MQECGDFPSPECLQRIGAVSPNTAAIQAAFQHFTTATIPATSQSPVTLSQLAKIPFQAFAFNPGLTIVLAVAGGLILMSLIRGSR
jgi:hypothetical protein